MNDPEIQRLEVANVKFKGLTGQDVNFRTFQTEVDQVYLLVFLPRIELLNNSLTSAFFSDKEQEQADVDAEAATANTNLQKVDSNLSHLKTQLNQKKTELKSCSYSIYIEPNSCKSIIDLERTLKTGLGDHQSLDAALKEATIELNHRTSYASFVL